MTIVRMKCPECGSTHITKDAMAESDETTQQWVLCATYDCETCQDCEAERDGLALRVEIAADRANPTLASEFVVDDSYLHLVPEGTPTAGLSATRPAPPTGEYCLADGDA